MNDDPRYDSVAGALPAQLPPLNRKDSVRYATRLVKRFGKLGLGSPNQIRPASLSDWRCQGGRRVWISTKPTPATDHDKGWGRLIHDCSHLVFQKRHPTFRPHDGGHAALEREIAEYVARKGWLAPRPERKVANDPLARKQERHQRLLVRLENWERKERRAQTAIRKIRRALARHARQ